MNNKEFSSPGREYSAVGQEYVLPGMEQYSPPAELASPDKGQNDSGQEFSQESAPPIPKKKRPRIGQAMLAIAAVAVVVMIEPEVEPETVYSTLEPSAEFKAYLDDIKTAVDANDIEKMIMLSMDSSFQTLCDEEFVPYDQKLMSEGYSIHYSGLETPIGAMGTFVYYNGEIFSTLEMPDSLMFTYYNSPHISIQLNETDYKVFCYNTEKIENEVNLSYRSSNALECFIMQYPHYADSQEYVGDFVYANIYWYEYGNYDSFSGEVRLRSGTFVNEFNSSYMGHLQDGFIRFIEFSPSREYDLTIPVENSQLLLGEDMWIERTNGAYHIFLQKSNWEGQIGTDFRSKSEDEYIQYLLR